MKMLHSQPKEPNNLDFKHYNVSMAIYDHALNIWNGLRVYIEQESTGYYHDVIAQPKKDNGLIHGRLFSVLDTTKPETYKFSISTEYNPNGKDLITGSYTSIKNKDTGEVEIIDLKYDTDSELKVDVSLLIPGENDSIWVFLMKITACENK